MNSAGVRLVVVGADLKRADQVCCVLVRRRRGFFLPMMTGLARRHGRGGVSLNRERHDQQPDKDTF